MGRAARVLARNAIYFVMGKAVTRIGWTVEPGAWLDIPRNAFDTMRGQRPYPAIGRAVDDPLHYKICMDPEQAEPEEWVDTWLRYGGTFSERAWLEYASTIPIGPPPPATSSDEEEAAFERAMRNIRGGVESCLE